MFKLLLHVYQTIAMVVALLMFLTKYPILLQTISKVCHPLTGVKESTACGIIHRVARAIASRKDDFIAMPDHDEMRELANITLRDFRIPGQLQILSNTHCAFLLIQQQRFATPSS